MIYRSGKLVIFLYNWIKSILISFWEVIGKLLRNVVIVILIINEVMCRKK